MKIVYMGTPEFAVPSLDILLQNGYNVVGVVTVPDKPAGRGQQIQQSAVKRFAIEKGLKVLQPEKLKDPEFIEELRSLQADLQIVVAFRMLPEIVWNMPKAGTYNLHASLLPKYRGAAPINWAIINGEHESGITTFKLKHEIDTGNVLFQEKVPISETDTAGDLHDKLMLAGSALVLKTVKTIEESLLSNSEPKFTAQDDKLATHAPKIFRETCRIHWDKPVKKIHDLIRGLSPYPGAYTQINDEKGNVFEMKIFRTKMIPSDHKNTNGLLIAHNGKIHVYCSGGILEIQELQLQGKKRMNAEEFLRGFRLPKEQIIS